MVFTSPFGCASPDELSTSLPIGDHVLNAEHSSDPLFVCALSGRTYHRNDMRERVDRLTRALAKELGWRPETDPSWSKVVAIFSHNTIDYMLLTWAIHRLGGICLLLHATSSSTEIAAHLRRVRCSAVFTCEPLLSTLDKAQDHVGDTPLRTFILDVDSALLPDGHVTSGLTSIEQLQQQGAALPPVGQLHWTAGDATSRVAYLCPTSGTSGPQKLALLPHSSLLANVVQFVVHEKKFHRRHVALNFLPCSHIYGLLLCHMMVLRGDTMVLHPNFDLNRVLASIPQYRIERLYMVPSIISALVRNSFLLDMADLSSVTTIVSGAAPFSQSLAEGLHALRPDWVVLPAWGLTEGGGASSLTHPDDFVAGSSGPLMPFTQARLVDKDGQDITTYGISGEIYLKSPSNLPGYLDDTARGNASVSERWLPTGDVGLFKLSPRGIEHLWVVDRAKDMIKVKGMQVAPAELESHLIQLPCIAEVAVIGVEDAVSGERPKAFVVAASDESEHMLRAEINRHVESSLSEPHWLGSRIEFVDTLPKTSSGKIMRRALREKV